MTTGRSPHGRGREGRASAVAGRPRHHGAASGRRGAEWGLPAAAWQDGPGRPADGGVDGPDRTPRPAPAPLTTKEIQMGKRARKKKARKKSSANHGNRPNS